jgi:hypothetical protein
MACKACCDCKCKQCCPHPVPSIIYPAPLLWYPDLSPWRYVPSVTAPYQPLITISGGTTGDGNVSGGPLTTS